MTEFGAKAKRVYIAKKLLGICVATKYTLRRDIEFQDMRSSMLRHSVLCRNSGARHCVATRLCAHDRHALSRQCGITLRCIATKKAMRER